MMKSQFHKTPETDFLDVNHQPRTFVHNLQMGTYTRSRAFVEFSTRFNGQTYEVSKIDRSFSTDRYRFNIYNDIFHNKETPGAMIDVDDRIEKPITYEKNRDATDRVVRSLIAGEYARHDKKFDIHSNEYTYLLSDWKTTAGFDHAMARAIVDVKNAVPIVFHLKHHIPKDVEEIAWKKPGAKHAFFNVKNEKDA